MHATRLGDLLPAGMFSAQYAFNVNPAEAVMTSGNVAPGAIDVPGLRSDATALDPSLVRSLYLPIGAPALHVPVTASPGSQLGKFAPLALIGAGLLLMLSGN